VCSEMWAGDISDLTTLLPVMDRLQQHFAIGRVCVVVDRGMQRLPVTQRAKFNLAIDS
jgi:hypothetical protein